MQQEHQSWPEYVGYHQQIDDMTLNQLFDSQQPYPPLKICDLLERMASVSIFRDLKKNKGISFYMRIKNDHERSLFEQYRKSKNQFIKYIQGKADQHPVIEKKNRIYSKQINTYHTYISKIPKNYIVYIIVKPSKQHKCNIILKNLKGEILMFYRNILQKKKQGKICKIIENYSQALFFIKDNCKNDQRLLKTVQKFVQKTEKIIYCVRVTSDVKTPQQNNTNKKEFQQIELQEKQIIIQSELIKNLYKDSLKELLGLQVQKIQQQEEEFLQNFRTPIKQQKRDLYFDCMGINIWRNQQTKEGKIQNIILDLYQKQIQFLEKNIEKKMQQHITKRVPGHITATEDLIRNCSYCEFKSLHQKNKNIKRTNQICKTCSYERDRTLYLCGDCIQVFHQEYHTSIKNSFDSYFSKEKIQRNKIIKRKKINQTILIKEEQQDSFVSEQSQKEFKKQNAKPSVKESTLKLDKVTESCFKMIQKFKRQGNHEAAKHCINMMRTSVIKTVDRYTKEKSQASKNQNIKMQNEEEDIQDQKRHDIHQ